MLADSALVGALFLLGFISLGVAILVVFRYWLVDAVLETGAALGLLFAILLGSGWAVKSTSPLLMGIWIFVLLGGSIGWPLIAAYSDKRTLYRIYEEKITRLLISAQGDFQNPGAWREIGELYFKMNRYDEAIAAYKEAIRLNPPDVQEVRRLLNRALDYRAGLPTEKMILCSKCELETRIQARCQKCGEPLELDFFDRMSQPKNLRDIVYPAIVFIVTSMAIFTVFSNLAVPTKAAFIGICVVIDIFFLWKTIAPSTR